MEPSSEQQRDIFYRIARIFRPDLEHSKPEELNSRIIDILGILLTTPMAIGGSVWLMVVTDWGSFIHYWPMFILITALILLLGRLRFYFVVDLEANNKYGYAIGTLEGTIKWSAIFLYGPPILWIDLITSGIPSLTDKSHWKSRDSRWNLLRNVTFTLTSTCLFQMITLTIYRAIGGVIPIPGLSLNYLLLGSAAITIQLALDTFLLWTGYLSYALWAMRKTLAPRVLVSLPILLFMGYLIPYMANLFAVPLAGIYSQHGLPIYLIFTLAVVLVGLLVRQMSQTNEDSRQQTVQLEKLEALGRAILSAPPDTSTLADILAKHASAMFMTSHMGIWVADRTLLIKPEEWAPQEQEPIRNWVSVQREAHTFTTKDPLPWSKTNENHHAQATAPILDGESNQPVGGIYVELLGVGRTWNRKALGHILPSLQGLAAQVASAFHRAKVYEETLAHQKTQQELAVARHIQTSFLPRNLPQVPGLQLAASLEPAREMSGDFYDLIPLSKEKLGILIADVADKGVGPALYMALSRTLIRTFASQYETHPEKVLWLTNRRILQDAGDDLFVTAFYGVFDSQNGKLTYANAGHNPPWAFAGVSGERVCLRNTGMALGVDESVEWKKAEIILAREDTLFLYTDGATDAQNGQGEFFGESRLMKAVLASLQQSAEELHNSVLAEIRAFIGNTPQFDDITLLVIKRAETS